MTDEKELIEQIAGAIAENHGVSVGAWQEYVADAALALGVAQVAGWQPQATGDVMEQARDIIEDHSMPSIEGDGYVCDCCGYWMKSRVMVPGHVADMLRTAGIIVTDSQQTGQGCTCEAAPLGAAGGMGHENHCAVYRDYEDGFREGRKQEREVSNLHTSIVQATMVARMQDALADEVLDQSFSGRWDTERHRGFEEAVRCCVEIVRTSSPNVRKWTCLSVADTPKMIKETLLRAQSAIQHRGPDEDRKASDIALLGRLISECDWHRPIGPDGKHGNLHTSTCGCEDKS